MSILVDDEQRAKENRERVARERETQPYYWWEFPDLTKKATPQFDSNPKGLAKSRQELMRRNNIKE